MNRLILKNRFSIKKKQLQNVIIISLFLISLIGFTFPKTSGADAFVVKGALFIDEVIANPGVKVMIIFDDGSESELTFEGDGGFNYNIGFTGHEGKTGNFSIFYEGSYFIPYDNASINISSSQSIYHANLHINSSDEISTNNSHPYEPSNPNPTNGAKDVLKNVFLNWTGGDPDENDTVTYEIYFGTTSHPTESTIIDCCSYNPGLLNESTKYFWQIIAWDEEGLVAEGSIWNFTTGENQPPNELRNPTPGNGEANVDIEPELSWTGGDKDGDPVKYDVYFGTNSNPPKVVSNQTETCHKLEFLDFDTTYYWKIAAWDSNNAKKIGDVWNFTTSSRSSTITADAGESYIGVVGEKITFDASGSSVSSGSIDGCKWAFGDGDTTGWLTGSTVIHKYNETGTFTVVLMIKGENGTKDRDTTTVTINENSSQPVYNYPPTTPTVNGPAKGNKNKDLKFTALSTDPDGDSIEYIFDWGDGSDPERSQPLPSGTGASKTHKYSFSSSYTIKIHAIDEHGAVSGTETVQVEIDIHNIIDNSNKIGYLIDDDSDGTYDRFFSYTTSEKTNVGQSDGKYLIDEDNDGKYDYIYDTIMGSLLPYKQNQKEEIPWMVILILAIVAVCIAIIFACRQKIIAVLPSKSKEAKSKETVSLDKQKTNRLGIKGLKKQKQPGMNVAQPNSHVPSLNSLVSQEQSTEFKRL